MSPARAAFLLFLAAFNQILLAQPSQQQPATSLWQAVKKQLSAPNGRQFFKENVENSALPILYGTLISGDPADHPDTFLVAMDGNANPEIRLKLNHSLPKPLPKGTKVAFEGIAESFSAEPFLLTLKVEEIHKSMDVPNLRIRKRP